MNEAITLNNESIFLDNIRKNKKIVIKNIEKNLDKAKISMLKHMLSTYNFEFDDTITDYNLFVKSVLKELNDKDYANILAISNNINKNIDEVFKKLKGGSTNAFTEFMSNTFKKVIVPIAKSATLSLAGASVIGLMPTVGTKITAGSAILGASIFKMNKNNKESNLISLNNELNKILQELEITIDKNKKIIDTRFDSKVQEVIIEFLEKRHIIFKNTGYLSIRNTIYNLEVNDKLELVKKINVEVGNKIDIDERIKGFDKSLLTKAKENVIAPIVKTTAAGLGIATSVNAIDPAILATPLNTIGGYIAGNAFQNLISTKWIGDVVKYLTTAVSGGLTAFGKYIPVVGELLNKTFAIENICTLTASGFILGSGIVLGKTLISPLINYIKNYKNNKKIKEILKKDAEYYLEDNQKEIAKIQEDLKFNYESDKVIIELVCRYMDELEIEYSKIPENIKELKLLIENLDNKNKKDVLKLLISLEDFNQREPKTFKKCVKKAGKFLFTAAVCSLASLSIYDILSGGGFLQHLNEKIYNIDNTYMTAVPDYKEIVEPKKVEVSSPPISPTPSRGEIPSLEQFQNLNTTLKPNVASTGTNNVINTYINNKGVFLENLKQLDNSEMLASLLELGNDRLIIDAVKSLDNLDVYRLTKYLNSGIKLNNSNEMNYKILSDALNTRILEYNNELDRKLALLHLTNQATAGINTPVIMAEEIKDTKKNKGL